MNDKPKRKLILSRETITTLQSDELVDVYGGISTSTVTSKPTTQVSLCLPNPPITLPNSISIGGGDGSAK